MGFTLTNSVVIMSDKIQTALFDTFLKVFLIGCSVFFIPGEQFYGAQEMFFQYGVISFLALTWALPRKREVTNKWFGVVIAYAVLNTVIFHFNPEARIKLLNLFLGAFFIKEMAERIDLNFKTMGNLLALFCAFNVFWLILQIRNIDPVFTSAFRENMPQIDKVGFMGLKANLGVLAAISAPFIYFANPFNVLICLPLLYFGQSSTAVFAFVSFMLFVLWHDHRKLFKIALFLIVTAGAYYILKIDMPEGQFGKRLVVWSAGLSYLAGTNLWFGNGLGSWAQYGFTTIQENGQPQTWLWAHNEYLQYFFELGIAGVIALYVFFKKLYLSVDFSLDRHRKAVAIAFPVLINSFFHFPFHLGRFSGFLCYGLASIFALLTYEDKE